MCCVQVQKDTSIQDCEEHFVTASTVNTRSCRDILKLKIGLHRGKDGSPVNYTFTDTSTLGVEGQAIVSVSRSLLHAEAGLDPLCCPSGHVDELRPAQFLCQGRARFRASSAQLADHVHFPVGVGIESSFLGCIHHGSQRHVFSARHVSFSVFGRFSHVHHHHVLSGAQLRVQILHRRFGEPCSFAVSGAGLPERHPGTRVQARTAHERARSRAQRTRDDGQAHRWPIWTRDGRGRRLATPRRLKPSQGPSPSMTTYGGNPSKAVLRSTNGPQTVQLRSLNGPWPYGHPSDVRERVPGPRPPIRTRTRSRTSERLPPLDPTRGRSLDGP